MPLRSFTDRMSGQNLVPGEILFRDMNVFLQMILFCWLQGNYQCAQGQHRVPS